MRTECDRLWNKDQTGRAMYRLARQYAGDLSRIYRMGNDGARKLADMSVPEMFDFVRKLPYKQDKKPIEVVMRPGYIIRHAPNGIDCKKKAILMGAYFYKRGIPFRFIASSRRKDRKITHVYPQAKLRSRWVNMDATYPHYRPGQRKRNTKTEVLKG